MTLTLTFIRSWSRIYIILLASALVVADRQTVLGLAGPPSHTTGIIRRFTWDNEQQREDILRPAMKNGAHIWQVADSHVDIYSHFSDKSLPAELLDIPHTISMVENHRPLQQPKTNAGWGLESLTNSTYHDTYHPLYEIDQFILELARLHPDLVRIHNLGHSAQGREMLGMTLSTPSNTSTLRSTPGPGKLGFVIIGAQHAREWIATATSIYLAHALVADTSEPHSLRTLLNAFDFHIVPAPNPDGYAYTWEADRYWYKNRQLTGPRSKCIGLDMNRNWGYKWKPTAGDVPTVMESSVTRPKPPADPCSHWYPGRRPFESPEVNNIANFVATLPNLVGFLDLRSYGQMLSVPFSYTCERWPKDAEDMIEAATGATQALKTIHGTHYQTGSLCRLLYAAPGNILDWMYKRVGIKYAYVVHLRDTGTYGFSLPEQWIRPVGEETTKMVEYLSKFIASRTKRKF